MVGPNPFGADGAGQARDNPTQTLVLSSASFYLDGMGSIGVGLIGGMDSGSAPTSYAGLRNSVALRVAGALPMGAIRRRRARPARIVFGERLRPRGPR
jgi:hypothetical protein